MARARTSTALALFAGLGLAASTAAQVPAPATDWKAIQKPPLRPFTPQQPVRVALPNGLVIFLQEDHELPLVRGSLRIRGGSREEPAAKTGLVSLYGQAWRTGGTKARTGDQLDDFLEARGARVEAGGGLDSTFLSFDTLKDSFEDVFTAFVELLQQPEFREEKLALAKNQANTGIARRNDDPMGIAGREVRKLAYGADSPYARVTEYATIAAVTRDDLLSWHKAYVHPNNAVLGVIGDFDAKQMEARLRKALGGWQRGPVAKKAEARFDGPKPGVYFIQKDDVNQSNIRMVHMGTTRDNPDFYAIEVMNEIFGGGFSARLFSNIRSKKGLAYSVGGGVGMNWDHPGVFALSMGTKSGSTAAAVDALYEEIDNLKQNPATSEELQRAKDAILNSFIFRFDTRQKVLSERVAYEFYGYPADWLARYRAGIEKVGPADVARAADKYVSREKIALLVVGKAQELDRPLSSFGPVTTLDITIPDGTPKKPAGSAASGTSPEARELFAKVVEALGGAARVKEVKALRQKSTQRMKTPMGEQAIESVSLIVFPDRLRSEIQSPMGAITQVVTPEAAFMTGAMGQRDIPASQKEAMIRDLKTNPIAVAQRIDDPKVALILGGPEMVGDVEARILDVNVDGAESRWLVDPRNGYILRSVSRVVGPTGPTEQTVEYSDRRKTDGLNAAMKRRTLRGGEETGTTEILEIQVNPPVDPKAFEKPSGDKPNP
jgi:zinc protease